MFARSFSAAPSRSSSGRGWWLLSLCALLSLMLPRTASAQTLPQPSPTNIERNLLSILQTCKQLQSELTTQQRLNSEQSDLLRTLSGRLQDSANQIDSLQAQLTSSQDSQQDSLRQLTELSSLLAKSQDSLRQLSTDFEALKAQRDKDVLALQGERNRAEARADLNRTLAIIGYSALAIFGGYEVGHALKAW